MGPFDSQSQLFMEFSNTIFVFGLVFLVKKSEKPPLLHAEIPSPESIAKAMGAAWIITTCSSRHADFVRQLGANEVIDTGRGYDGRVAPV